MTRVDRMLTTGDFSTLSRLSDDWNSSGYWLGPHVRRMLQDAVVVFAADLPADVASLGSRVAYSTQDQARCTAELTALALVDRAYLPVRLPVGLALLGRREGARFDVQLEDGSLLPVTLEQVLAQPERAWPGRFDQARP